LITPRSPKQICPTCGAFVTESFCSRCGEKLVEQADFAFSTFAADVVKEFTNLDGRVLHSVAAILSQPGLLTIEYFRGRRVAYLRPVQLFVLANVLYFLIQPIIGFNTFTTPLRIHMNSLWHSPLAQRLVDKKVHDRTPEFRDYEREFNQVIHTQSRSLVFIMIPLFAVAVSLVYFGSKRFFVEHLIFSLHYYAFFLMFLCLLGGFLRLAPYLRVISSPFMTSDAFVSSLIGIGVLVYLHLALKRVYQQGTLWTFAKAIVLTSFVLIIVQFYRFVLFFTAYLAI